MLATFAIAGHLEAASFAIGPLKIVPFGFPLSSFSTTTALSSNFTRMPSILLYSLRCLTTTANTTCFRMSGLPFFTATWMRSPMAAVGARPFLVCRFRTVMILTIFAPELSHASTHAPTGNARVMLALIAFIILHQPSLLLQPFFVLLTLLHQHFFLFVSSFRHRHARASPLRRATSYVSLPSSQARQNVLDRKSVV